MPDVRERRRRRGRRGETRILDLINHYWDQIEGDFAYHLHVDARDFLRGRRPWSQFLTYCHTVANIDGSQLWAAQLADDRFLPIIEAQLDNQSASRRPPLRGHTAEVGALYMVANQIRMLIRAMGVGELPMIAGPEMPAERAQKRRHAAQLAHINTLLNPK